MEFNLFDPINHNLNELSALLTSTAQALDSLQLSTESNASLLMKPMDSSSSNGGLLDSGDSGIWSGASTSESLYPCTPPPTRSYDCATSMWSFSPSSYLNSSSTSFSSSSSSNSVDKGAEGLYNGNGSWSSSLPSSPSALHSSSIGSSASSCFSRQMNSNSPPPGMLPIGYNHNNANLRQTLQLLNALQQELQEKEAANMSPWNSASRTEEINSLVSSVHQLIATLKHQAPAPSPPPSSPISDVPSHPSSPQGNRGDSGRFRKSSIGSIASSSAGPQKQYHHRGGNQHEARYTWSGQLPARVQKNPSYSCKVFLGGVPCEISMGSLLRAFQPFGNVKVEWPGKLDNPPSPQRYAYLIFEHERQVKNLLQNCMYKYGKEGSYYFKLTSKRLRYHSKDIQVIPWSLGDSNYVRCETSKLDPQRTIFVGALHGMINAEALATIMQELFGGVVYAGIDTDKNRYPIGSARVTFSNRQSYMKAVAAEYVEIRTPKFFKTVQVDPYLEDATCSVCALQQGPYFCRSLSCFKYFCRTCFEVQHIGESLQSHRPIMRNANRQNGSSPATSM